jgi:hypothetical protein
MSSLVFRVLDQHVVRGLADEPALSDARGLMSFAELLHESASIAGALSGIGVSAGTPVHLDLPSSRERVVAALACARLGAVPQADAGYRLAGDPVVLHTPETEVPWDLLLRAGRVDPAPAPAADPEGYEQQLREDFGDVLDALAAGRTVTL